MFGAVARELLPKMIRGTSKTIFRRWLLAGAVAALAAAPATVRAHEPQQQAENRRLAVEKTGELSTREGLRLRLVTDVGAVRVFTDQDNQVTYRVRVETDAAQPDAERLVQQFMLVSRGGPDGIFISGHVPWKEFRGRLWVSIEVRVPRNYNLDVATQAGNIIVQDVNGSVALATGGGDVVVGRISGQAQLETRGGHIKTQDIGGTLVAVTVGGHIVAGNVAGDAVLRSGGGHVKVLTVGGRAQMESGGGNISIEKTSAGITAVTAGGRIDVGEAHGAIRARTGGGGVRVARVAGPVQLDSSGGSIYLTRVLGPVQASTTSGTITAWLVPEGKFEGGSQLICAQGDIVVYLPSKLAVTIDATIDGAAGHRILFDPELPLQIQPVTSPQGLPQVRGRAVLNGGGQVLKLQTVAGNIQVRVADSRSDQNERIFFMQRSQAQKSREEVSHWIQGHDRQSVLHRAKEEKPKSGAQTTAVIRSAPSVLGEVQARLRNAWLGRVRVDYALMKTRMVAETKRHPDYPEIAKRARIQGIVHSELIIDREGRVIQVRKLGGHDMLFEAAAQALRAWRFQPTVIDGKAVEVITVVPIEFRLN